VSKLASADMERLTKLLSDELGFYESIRNLTEEQTKLLAKDDIEEFNISLDKREGLIEKIKGLHQESEPLMQSYVSLSENNKNNEIDEIKKKITKTLEICAELNEQNITTMRNKTEEHTKKIDEQSAKRKGIGGYAQSVPNVPEIFDKKS